MAQLSDYMHAIGMWLACPKHKVRPWQIAMLLHPHIYTVGTSFTMLRGWQLCMVKCQCSSFSVHSPVGGLGLCTA